MKSIIVLSLILAFSTSAMAKPAGISASHMKSYQAEYEYYIENDNGSHTKAGTWSDLVESSSDKISRTIMRHPLQGGTDLIRTVVADKSTLSPVFQNQRFGANLEGVFYTQYDAGALKQIYIANGRAPAKILNTELDNEVLETNLQGLFAAALPLTGQTEIQVTGYSTGAAPTLKPVSFFVTEEESITVLDKEILAWKVTDSSSDWVYWVRREPPYLVKVVHPAQDGRTMVSFLASFEASQSP